MVQASKETFAAQAPKPRIVQFNKRRFSIRLETVFWQFLETLAEQRDLRLGQFIATVAGAYRGKNLSSYLRVICMLESERVLARAAIGSSGDNLLSAVQGCPSPGLILSRYRRIMACNDAFRAWLGPEHPPLIGAEVNTVVQLRAAGSFQNVWTELVAGRRRTAQAHVLYVRPGRMEAIQARLVALRSATGEHFHAVMWLAAPGGKHPTLRTRAEPASDAVDDAEAPPDGHEVEDEGEAPVAVGESASEIEPEIEVETEPGQPT